MALSEVEAILHDALARAFDAATRLGALGTVLQAGVSAARDVLYERNFSLAQVVVSGALSESLFSDPETARRALSPARMATDVVTNQVANAGVMAAATNVVFAHAIADSAALECCKAIILARPHECARRIVAKKVEMGRVLDGDAEGLLREVLDTYLNDELARRSLVAKCDFILDMLPAGSKPPDIKNYEYRRERLQNVDGIRHDVVHHEGPTGVRRLAEGDEEFLRTTALFLVTKTMLGLGVKVDPKELGVRMSRVAGPAVGEV